MHATSPTRQNTLLYEWLAAANETATHENPELPTPDILRQNLAEMTDTFVTNSPPLPWVRDLMVPDADHPVPVRLYDPAPEQCKPVCLYFHGGGHMAGGIAVYDAICRKIASAAHCLVASVGYRLAPENPYPAGLHDCLAATRSIAAILQDQGRNWSGTAAIAGDSGGGALAATISALAQHDATLPVRRQILIYPSLDYTLSQPSIISNGRGYLLEADRIRWYFDHYFQNGENRQKASPLFMPASALLPDTLIITAGLCPLRDEGVLYAGKIASAGAKVTHIDFPELIHAYLNLENLARQACTATYEAIGHFLNE